MTPDSTFDDPGMIIMSTGRTQKPIGNTRILKLTNHDEELERSFELDYLASLTVEERFLMLERKRDEIRAILEPSGHGRTRQTITRA